MAQIHISISAEPIAHIGDFVISNSMLTTWIVTAILLIIAFVFPRTMKKVPSRLQSLFELPIEMLWNLSKNIAESKAAKFFPFVMTFFLFILFSNWIGLLPGVGTIGINDHGSIIPLFRAPTADLNTTIALALISFGLIQFYGFRTLGLSYAKKFVNISNPIYTFVGILELIGEFAKIVSFAFRLFGNIFAGEVLLVVTATLLPILAPAPFYGLELFVGVIQALVFAVLTLVFLNMATVHAEH